MYIIYCNDPILQLRTISFIITIFILHLSKEMSLTCNGSTLSCHLISHYFPFLIPYTKHPGLHLSFKANKHVHLQHMKKIPYTKV